jgi:hypothetical protein
MNITKGGMTT